MPNSVGRETSEPMPGIGFLGWAVLGLNENVVKTGEDIFACVICYNPLTLVEDSFSMKKSAVKPNLECSTCKISYFSDEAYIDLTVSRAAKVHSKWMAISTEIFRNSLFPFIYERGYRNLFKYAGFPGLQKEAEMAMEYLKPVLGGNIVDASCGSGLFSRWFTKSGMFSLVVALDFSEHMLRQCYEFISQEKGISEEKLVLVRADISRLPFASNSVDALHAGAGIHCWPSHSAAFSEISRVLRPGGVFVATTFVLDGNSPDNPVARIILQGVAKFLRFQFPFSKLELEDLCRTCGMVGYTYVRNGAFIMFSATKPT
ncbi:hypothetical protein GIB67_026881 [Kingdonia uniflora]|uniref:Methyltransferase type 11 domain-containing protein n=1 Tax=Kingdonia uniflora TaxID=39325 RepID=A0A7J7M851_9MAGN|nr:hypothetical protein GIB67_026881 [Kingdonia uniflora]